MSTHWRNPTDGGRKERVESVNTFRFSGKSIVGLTPFRIYMQRLNRENWDKFGQHDQEQLLGLNIEGGNWALLGRMRQSAKKTVFSNDDNRKND